MFDQKSLETETTGDTARRGRSSRTPPGPCRRTVSVSGAAKDRETLYSPQYSGTTPFRQGNYTSSIRELRSED